MKTTNTSPNINMKKMIINVTRKRTNINTETVIEKKELIDTIKIVNTGKLV